jgi:hypothetical protein
MTLVILLILALLAVLIVAGPALEQIIDRIWPPDDPARRGEPMDSGRSGDAVGR